MKKTFKYNIIFKDIQLTDLKKLKQKLYYITINLNNFCIEYNNKIHKYLPKLLFIYITIYLYSDGSFKLKFKSFSLKYYIYLKLNTLKYLTIKNKYKIILKSQFIDISIQKSKDINYYKKYNIYIYTFYVHMYKIFNKYKLNII